MGTTNAHHRLQRWIEEKRSKTVAAELIGCHASNLVHLIRKPDRRPGLELAFAIEKATASWPEGPIFASEWVARRPRTRMCVYIAGASAEPQRVRRWMDRVVDDGHELAWDWLKTVERAGSANEGLGEELRHSASKDDLEAIERADVLWLLAPEAPSCGAWAEVGYAIRVRDRDRREQYDRPLRILVSGKARGRCIFTSFADKDFDSDSIAFEWLQQQARP